MKKGISTIIICFLVTILLSCGYGKINVRKDEFTNSKIIDLKLEHKSKETYMLISYRLDIIYIREINKEGKKPLILNCRLKNIPMNKPDLESKSVIKINDKAFNLKLNDFSGKTITEVSESKHYGMGDKDMKTESSSSKEYTGKIIINEEIEKLILNNNSFAIRLYLGPEPLTFFITKNNLTKIKKVINHN